MSRAKRSSLVVTMMETPSGFSIVEGVELLNKPPQPQREPNYSRESAKPIYKRTNFVLLKKAESQKITQPPSPTDPQCKYFCEWFDINQINQLERDEVLSWGIGDQEQKIKKYKQVRNNIVNLYLENNGYLYMSEVRKHIATDAYFIMKVYTFLNSNGIINYNSGYTHNDRQSVTSDFHVIKHKGNKATLLQGDLKLQQKIMVEKPTSKQEQCKTLWKLTEKMRPYCDYCGVHCGVTWLQHNRIIEQKEIRSIMRSVNPKNPTLVEKKYQIILCPQCYDQGNYPLLLTMKDFKKYTVNDRLYSKKRSKRRKKERKGDEVNDQDDKDDRDSVSQECKEKVKIAINTLVENGNHRRKQSLPFIRRLLELVKLKGEDWESIQQTLQAEGYFYSVEQIISSFLRLPQLGVTTLEMEYQDQEFWKANKISTYDRKIQQKALDYAYSQQKQLKQLSKEYAGPLKQQQTKPRLQERFIELLKKQVNQNSKRLQMKREVFQQMAHSLLYR